jgi:hypothetical protein
LISEVINIILKYFLKQHDSHKTAMRILFLTTILSLLAGCASTPPANVEKPEHQKPILSQSDKSKLIFVANVSTKLVDQKIGQLTGGLLCVFPRDLVWIDNPAALNAIKEAIATTMSKNGYNVYSGLIQAGGEKDAEILVGVGIEDIKANVCYSVAGKKGDASMRLKFEVLDNKTRNSFSSVVSGSGSVTEFNSTGDPGVFTQAAEMATDNFLADEAFFKATRK